MGPLKLGTIAISRDVVSHPLLGEAHVIEHDGRVVTAMSALDWARPTQIPVVAAPARLPPGAGGLLLNHIAELAQSAGVPALRYAGPYPTPALYRALSRSFRASADEATFTRDVLGRALRIARDEVPVDFAPAPHRRVELACGHAEVRGGAVERAVLDGTTYGDARGPGAIVRSDRGFAAELAFAGITYLRIAELDARGALLDGPRPIPPVHDPILGKTFPRELRVAIGELLDVPDVLLADAQRVLAEREITWADLGGRLSTRTPDGFAVHAALWQLGAPAGRARLVLALAEALAPVAVAAVLDAAQAQLQS